MLLQLREKFPVLLTVEENTLTGGFGDGVREVLEEQGRSLEGLMRVGLPDRFITHGTRDQLLELVGLTPERIAELVSDRIRGTGSAG